MSLASCWHRGLPLALIPLAALSLSLSAQEVDKAVLDAQEKRLRAVEKVRPAVVAVMAPGGNNGGSGVVIDPEGYALTNFHVVQATGNVMQCGLADGILYHAVVVGIDPVGDVALIKLLAKEKVKGADGKETDKPFPFAAMGDSDKVKPGDWSLAMGNPFLLATDFTPTITFGLVSGTHRYQYPSGTILEYTDCIQVDTSINPGNSGGPLFNLNGEVIGINGRGSFEKRGRVNSGVGYAISINQIRHFMGHLRAGFVADHATLGAVITPDEEGRSIISQVLEDCDAYRRGLREDDELKSFSGRGITSINQYKNVLGIYPRGWRLPMEFRHKNEETGQIDTREVLVRLMGVQPRDLNNPDGGPMPPPPMPEPGPGPRPMPPPRPGPKPIPKDSPAAKLYEAKPGFANHYFNKQERQRLVAAVGKHGDFSKLTGAWKFDGDETQPQKRDIRATIDEKLSQLGMGNDLAGIQPLRADDQTEERLREPRGSGGLLLALFQWRRFLTQGEKGFQKFIYAGHEPYYPEGTPKGRVEAEVIETELANVTTKWYFAKTDGTLLGLETYVKKDEDPCEVSFSDYKDVGAKKLPHKIVVRYGTDGKGQPREYASYTVKGYKLE